MSMTATRPLAPGPEEPIRHWTREEYYRAAELGLIGEDERVELLEGIIYRKMPEKPIHSSLMDEASEILLAKLAPQNVSSRIQHPIHLPNDSEPEPDLAIVRGRPRDYRKRHPTAEDILLLVEVANTYSDMDYGRKRRNYASAGIREYWIVNVQEGCLEVYRNPEQGFEEPFATLRAGDTVSPLAAPDQTIPVADLLP